MRTHVNRMERKLRVVVARRALPLLVPGYRQYVEWLHSTRSRSRERIFTRYFRSNHWGDESSLSGEGSNLEQTGALRTALPSVLNELRVRSLLDAPCGDYHWMLHVDLRLDRYIGGDIVHDLVRHLQVSYGRNGIEFMHLDISKDPLPQVDAILCRDGLVHFSFRQMDATVRNFKRSGAVYLLTTTFPDTKMNRDIITGDWRRLNPCAPPLNWPEPLMLINERCTQANSKFADKSLGVWKLASLPSVTGPRLVVHRVCPACGGPPAGD
jgi:hypothetical protein